MSGTHPSNTQDTLSGAAQPRPRILVAGAAELATYLTESFGDEVQVFCTTGLRGGSEIFSRTPPQLLVCAIDGERWQMIPLLHMARQYGTPILAVAYDKESVDAVRSVKWAVDRSVPEAVLTAVRHLLSDPDFAPSDPERFPSPPSAPRHAVRSRASRSMRRAIGVTDDESPERAPLPVSDGAVERDVINEIVDRVNELTSNLGTLHSVFREFVDAVADEQEGMRVEYRSNLESTAMAEETFQTAILENVDCFAREMRTLGEKVSSLESRILEIPRLGESREASSAEPTTMERHAAAIEQQEKRLAVLEELKKRLAGAESLEKRITALEGMKKRVAAAEEMKTRIAALEGIKRRVAAVEKLERRFDSVAELERRLTEAEGMEPRIAAVEAMEKRIAGIEEMKRRVAALEGLKKKVDLAADLRRRLEPIDELVSRVETVEILAKRLSEVEQLDLAHRIYTVEELERRFNRLQEMEGNRFDAVAAALENADIDMPEGPGDRMDPYVSFAKRIASMESAMASLRSYDGLDVDKGLVQAQLNDISLSHMELDDRLGDMEMRFRRIEAVLKHIESKSSENDIAPRFKNALKHQPYGKVTG